MEMSGKLIKKQNFDKPLFRSAHGDVDKRKYIAEMIREYHNEMKRE